MLLKGGYKYKQIITTILECHMDLFFPPPSPWDIQEYLWANLMSFLKVVWFKCNHQK